MMAKKMDEAEVKKECPSCGLGVPLDATICEFCGWDFEEEDEWIIQIEKLERDLLLEKQKFEPGTVNAKIESTLHTPVVERIEAAKLKEKAAGPATPAPAPSATPSAPSPKPSAPAQVPAPRMSSNAPEPAKAVRVRTVKPAETRVAEAALQPKKKVRLVRKVKQ